MSLFVLMATKPMWCSQVAQSYGLLLGTIVMVPKTAQTLAAILMLTFILTGGYFVRGQPCSVSRLLRKCGL